MLRIKFLDDDNKRHIVKTITWRVIASIDTFLISLILTNSYTIGITISVFEILTKTILYYFHERFWFKKIRFKK